MTSAIKLPWNLWTDKLNGGVEPDHVVMYTINNSVPKDAPPFVSKVISTAVKGTGRSAVITAAVEVVDGNTMTVVLEPSPFGGWSYMFKTGGQYIYDRATRSWKRVRHFPRPSALVKKCEGAAL